MKLFNLFKWYKYRISYIRITHHFLEVKIEGSVKIFFLELLAISKIAFSGELVWIFEMSASPLKYKAKKKFYLSIDQLKEQNENDDMTMVEFEVGLKMTF